MDPNATLRRLKELGRNWVTRSREEVLEYLELDRALYNWLKKGGFEPDWSIYPDAKALYTHVPREK